jgi:hypothetical protein
MRAMANKTQVRNAGGFTGPLAKQIVVADPLVVGLIAHGAPNGEEAVWQEYWKIIAEIKVERWRLLAEELGVDFAASDAWTRLAMALGERCVLGLQIKDRTKRGRGAPRKNYFDLYKDVWVLTADRKLTISAACEHLVKQDGPWKGKKAYTLENRFYEYSKLFKQKKSLDDDHILRRLDVAAGRI